MTSFMGLTQVHCDNSPRILFPINTPCTGSPSFLTESYARAMAEPDTPSLPFQQDMASAIDADIDNDIRIDIADYMPGQLDQLELELEPPLQVASPVFATPRSTATLNNAVHVGFEAVAARVKTIMTTCEPYKTMIAIMGPQRSDIMLTHTSCTVHYALGTTYDTDIFNMLATFSANESFASFFPQPPLAEAQQLALACVSAAGAQVSPPGS